MTRENNTSKLKGLVVVVFDTLRADFRDICRQRGIQLGNFQALQKLMPIQPHLRCGSFPTTPMRTDLFTGRLSFLREEWALPGQSEQTLIDELKQNGFKTALITDNYIVVIPRVGGMMLNYFDHVHFARGSAADPWAIPEKQTVADAIERTKIRPSRSANFEAQFIANTRERMKLGSLPFEEVFDKATTWLDQVSKQDNFLLWIETFGTHEPWIPNDWVLNQDRLSENLVFPAYSEKEACSSTKLHKQKGYYAKRIGEVDQSMNGFVEKLEQVMSGGDIGLLVLSDHGFLFGEYGYVGKPAESPLPPELHNLCCGMSQNLGGGIITSESSIQPHQIHEIIRSKLLGHNVDIDKDVLHIFGRNSPRSDYLSFACQEGYGFLDKSGDAASAITWLPWSALNLELKLVNHESHPIDLALLKQVNDLINMEDNEWINPFKRILQHNLITNSMGHV